MRCFFRAVAPALLLTLVYAPGWLRAADAPPKMEFNDVKEVAPGVFFRYSAIGPDGSNIPFGGSNNIWVVFEDYVAVIDANFPKEAADVIAAVKKTTDKPIRYVLDTHHHGDHAYGNAVFAAEGATVFAQANCARLLRLNGPKEFAEAGREPTGRKDVRDSKLKVPSLVFDDKLVLDDGSQRVEFLFLGHAHTSGDAFAYLPRHKLLCTGDACVNGAYNFMGHSDSASWVRVLERAQQFDIKYVLPGHGPIAGKDLLERQKHYFVELRRQVKQGIEDGKQLADIRKAIDMPWYKEWTTVSPAAANVEHVYNELTGRVAPWDLTEEYGVTEGQSPMKETPGWTAPKRIVVPNLMPADLAQLKRISPAVEFVPVKDAEAAAREAADADAVIGFVSPEIVKAGGQRLRWIQASHAGIDKDLSPELVQSNIVFTNTQRLHGPNTADQAFALLLSLTRGLREVLPGQAADAVWRQPKGHPQELHGKTMLIVGLGGIGIHTARRAQSFGMRILAVDPKEMERPDFVFSLAKPAKLMDLLPQADVVVATCPLTDDTKGLIGERQFDAMKKTAYLINVARGAVVKTDDLTAALKNGRIAGAGLDVTDPEPLPDGHPLWKMPGCVISPHIGGLSPEARERQWRLWRENVRRFVAGEKLLCVVDKANGY
jgi:phosphoglycerate dehydrogenase-like enzyme/glyoxylase-like metal-dependent hydrolase (beta-lactamase superfamily II)